MNGTVPSLPWPVTWLDCQGLKLALYDTGPPVSGPAPVASVPPQRVDGGDRVDRPGLARRPAGRAGSDVPVLVLHSINAAASAFEWEPFVMSQARRRRVFALDLPGFGLSDKPDEPYSPAQMAAAIDAAIDHIGAAEVDVAALSLSCEFAAQAVLLNPERVRSLALVSPTGMESRRIGERYEGKTRKIGWLRRVLRRGRFGQWLYRLLTVRPSIHFFLARTWGTQAYDRRMLEHALRCARQPGATYAPLDFLSFALFTVGIIERYRALPVPVWVAHGRRGAFTDFGSCPERTGTAAAGNTFRLQREVFDGGAMPHFEMQEAFEAAYLRFLNGLAPSAFRFRRPASLPGFEPYAAPPAPRPSRVTMQDL